jgi:hypothetical protein
MLLALAAAMVLSGCLSSGPDSEAAVSPADPVAVSLVSGRDLRARFGQTFANNPFLSPKPTILEKADDFIALELKVAAGAGADLEVVRAEAVDEKGSVCASFYNREKFTDLAMVLSGPYMDNASKKDKIGWYYLPALKMRVPSGTHSYIMVLVGKHPLPETLSARVEVRLDEQEKSFEIPVTLAETG